MAIEPNDTLTQATETGLTSTNPGTFTIAATIGDNPDFRVGLDVDLYKVQVNVGENLIIDVLSEQNRFPLNPSLRLFDSQGREIAANDDFGTDIRRSFLNFTASASDTYYIGISGTPNNSYNPLVAGSGTSDASSGNYSVEAVLAVPVIAIGTPGNDSLVGGNGNDSLSGVGGNDTLSGLSANDTLRGGDGLDLIFAGDGDDRIFGGNGKDRLFGEEGSDRISGGNDNDTINGGNGEDSIFGEAGNDLLSGGNRLDGGDGNDTLNGSNSLGPGERLLGGNGNDRITGNLGDDFINGGSGDDTLIGTSNTSDTFFPPPESDTLTGGLGKDTFVLGNTVRVFSSAPAIADLNLSEDKVQLKGSAADYFLDFFKTTSGVTNAEIIYDPGVTSQDISIAIVQNAPADLSLSNSAFNFV